MSDKTMWGWMIDHYGRENLEKLPLEKTLEIAWWFYNNPIEEKEIKRILEEFNLEFKEL